MKRRSPGLYVIAAALILAIGVPSAAVGFGEGRDAKLGKRNPSSGSLTRETQIIANNGSYGTRQSNKRNGEGGGAIYGCRSDLGKEPCVRANNLKGGRAFEFATQGKEGGSIEVKDTSGPPFTTNATGVATGLNADRVDGIHAGKITFYAPVGTALTEVFNFGGRDFQVLHATPHECRGVEAASTTRSKSTSTCSTRFIKPTTACSTRLIKTPRIIAAWFRTTTTLLY